jgi:hypothetical protein
MSDHPVPEQPTGDFWAAFVLIIVLPAFPVMAEAIATHHLKPDSLAIFAAMYLLGLSLVSKNRGFFAIGLLAGICATFIYGLSLKDQETDFVVWMWAAVFLAAFVHSLERYKRHIMQGEPFFEWLK